MKIHISVNELPLEVQKLYTENILYDFAIDYQYNNLLAEIRGSTSPTGTEVEVFNFTKYLKMDNRFNTYTVHLSPQEIVIELTV